MATWPTVEDYKAWAGMPATDTLDDDAITAALAAATTAVQGRCPALDPAGPCPDDVAQAVLLWANRLRARRGTPTGVVGIDETGQALVPGADPDINRLLMPYRAQVVG